MKTIKIIAGTFGYLPAGKNTVQLKDIKSVPFEVADTIADRLVLKGVAEIVGAAVAAEGKQGPAYNATMTKKELVKYAAGIGLELDEKLTKDKMIEALDAAIEQHGEDEDPDATDPDGTDDGEAPPVVNAADAVV